MVRENDTRETLLAKVEVATILGTLQSSLTYFPYLRKIWQKNTEEENLLGVSLTGIMDNPGIWTERLLEELKGHAVAVNQEWAKRLGLNPSTAITCVKPSGTVSQLVNSASGIHPRYSNYYVRTVRADTSDPLTKFMDDMGIPNEPDVMNKSTTRVFSFPIKAPKGSTKKEELSAIGQLKIWQMFQTHWCEHKPSITVNVNEDEWITVGAWVYNNLDDLSGVAFMPNSDHSYEQAPYQEITEEQYNELKSKMPESINWNLLENYEREDNTSGMQTLACSADSCEIVDIVNGS